MSVAEQIPNHVAIIMDGNGRWAKSRGMARLMGHTQGGATAKNIIKAAVESGVKYLTLYAFSSENWNRSVDEVNGLMKLLHHYIQKEKKSLIKGNIRFVVLGDMRRVPEMLVKEIMAIEEDTATNKGMTLAIALSYGGRDEILNAINKILIDYKNDLLREEDVDDNILRRYLYTKDIPDPDLLIRTGGELRISNFLLWQSAYTEFYFTDTKWPDFSKKDFDLALQEFQRRKRRYGKE